MGNCQAIDNAALLIQHPNSTKVDKLYSPVTAKQVMKLNPGHYVALLLTTTTMSPPSNSNISSSKNIPIRITKIKLLKPTDTLVLGHVYRLVTTQEVMKGLCAKKYAKTKQKQLELSSEKQEKIMTHESIINSKEGVKRFVQDNSKQVKHEKHRNSIGAKSRAWHPSLQSISEATS